MNVHDEYQACEECAQMIANGEGSDDHATAMADNCHLRGIELGRASVACTDHDECEGNYRTSPCEICGTRLHGHRHKVVVLCSHDECAAA